MLDIHYRRYLILLTLLISSPAWAVNPTLTTGGVEQAHSSNTCNPTNTIPSVVVPADADLMVYTAVLEGLENITGVVFNGSEAFVLGVDSGIRSNNGDVRVFIWTLADPTATTADVVISCNTGNMTPTMHSITNWKDVDIDAGESTGESQSSFAESHVTDCVMSSSQGDSGNTLIAVGGWQGADTDPFTTPGFVSIFDSDVGTTSGGMGHTVSYDVTPANSLTITASTGDDNACAMLELCADGSAACEVGGATRNRYKLIGAIWERIKTWWV